MPNPLGIDIPRSRFGLGSSQERLHSVGNARLCGSKGSEHQPLGVSPAAPGRIGQRKRPDANEELAHPAPVRSGIRQNSLARASG